MFQISPSPLPHNAFLQSYAKRPGHYADCFTVTVDKQVELDAFVQAFFTSPVMRLERLLLRAIGQRSTPEDVSLLASGKGDSLAGWSLEARDEQQILLTVFGGGIRTWLMCQPLDGGTCLLFGSAVIPKDTSAENPKLGWVIRALEGFHRFYARLVLWSAKRQLGRMG